MSTPFVRSYSASIALGLVLSLLQWPAMAQSDPLGDLIQQKTKPQSATAQPAFGAQPQPQPVTPSAPSTSQPSAVQTQPVTPSVSSPSPASSGSAWGQAGALGAAAAGALNGEGVSAATISSLGLPSLFGGSASNVAGVLQYCVQNNYLNKARDQVDSLKGGLLGMVGLQNDPAPQASNTNYASGLAGILMGGEGERFDLGTIQGNLKEKACDYVLQQAPSLL